MQDEIRYGGDADLRAQIERERRRKRLREQIGAKYSNDATEDELQAQLASELTAAGWEVRREVHCRVPLVGSRRIDLYCTATEETETALGMHAGFTFAVELKTFPSMSLTRQAYNQTVHYRSGYCWFDLEDGVHLAPPMFLAFSTAPHLGGRAGRDCFVSRMFWQYGSGYLWRGPGCDLLLETRIPKVVERKGRDVVTTADVSIRVTDWLSK